MRYSCSSAVEYDLQHHYLLLDKYTDKIKALSMYDGYVLKPTKIRGNKRYYSAKGPCMSGFGYIGGENNEQVQLIREHAFYKEAIHVIQANITALEGLLKVYSNTGADHINELLGACYSLPPDSILLRDESEADEWIRKQTARKNSYSVFDPASLTVTAFDGTLMRSRAEALHYEGFYIYNVPAIFELPYEIGGELLRPDFTILDIFTMTEKIWEHLGNWFHSNEYKRKTYRSDSIHRIDQYATIGFLPEFNLFLSFGTWDNVFDIQTLHRKIAMFAAPPPSMETINLLKRF